MLEAVATHLPKLFTFVSSAYGSPSNLAFGSYTIFSKEGIKQGDPLGPLLFCITMIDVFAASRFRFKVGYSDDITLGDSVEDLINEVKDLRLRTKLSSFSRP